MKQKSSNTISRTSLNLVRFAHNTTPSHARLLGRYGSRMKRIAILILSILFSVDTLSSEMDLAQLHEIVKVGVLPKPYDGFRVHIVLDKANYSVASLNVSVNSSPVPIKKEHIELLKNIDLARTVVGHEIFRGLEAPYTKLQSDIPDLFEVIFMSKANHLEDGSSYVEKYILAVDIENYEASLFTVKYENP